MAIVRDDVVQRDLPMRTNRRRTRLSQADVADVVAPVPVQEEVSRRARSRFEPERADQLHGGDVLRSHVRLEPMQVEFVERMAYGQLEPLAQVALARVGRERVVAHERALEHTAHDLRDVDDAGDRVVGDAAHEEAGMARVPRPSQIGLEGLGCVGRVHPRTVEAAGAACSRHEGLGVRGSRVAEVDTISPHDRAGHRAVPARANASSTTRLAAARSSNPSVCTSWPSRSL